MEAMPKWNYELKPDELLVLQLVGQQMQEVVTHNAPIMGLELMSPQQMKVALCNLNLRVYRSAYLALSNERPISTSPNTTSSITRPPRESSTTAATTLQGTQESSVRVPRQSIMRTPHQSSTIAATTPHAPQESTHRSTPKEGNQREVKLLDPIRFPRVSSSLPKAKELSPRKPTELELNKYGVKNYDPMWANDLKTAIHHGPPVILATMPAKPEEKKVVANPPSPRKAMRKVAFKQKPLNNLVGVS